MSSYKKPSNYTSIPVTCSTSREPLKTSKIDRIQQSPWRPATVSVYSGGYPALTQASGGVYSYLRSLVR